MASDAEGHDSPRQSGDLAVGTMVSRYRITRKIRAGGMGVVYEAEDTELNRPVAIKLLPDLASATDEAMTQFQREAQLAASLNHPNLVTVHDVGEHQGRPFFAMEDV